MLTEIIGIGVCPHIKCRSGGDQSEALAKDKAVLPLAMSIILSLGLS